MIIKFLQSPDAIEQPMTFPSVTRNAGRNIVNAPEFIGESRMSESTVIVAARLDERDFELARFAIPELAAFHDYEDWLDFRLGSIWGLEMAGFTVETIPVDLTAFIAWRRMTSAHLTVAALDRFARISELRNYEENGLQV